MLFNQGKVGVVEWEILIPGQDPPSGIYKCIPFLALNQTKTLPLSVFLFLHRGLFGGFGEVLLL